MPLKIIGAGFGRTGTDSTRVALNSLGFPCYHMRVVIDARNRGHLWFWREVAASPEGTQHDWERVFADYTACVDFPASCVWRELLAAYPDAKVLLTLHPGGPEAWYESTYETIYYGERLWHWRVIERMIPVLRRFNSMVRDLVWLRFLRGTMSDRSRAVARYLEHVDEVRAAVPSDRLLVFEVSEGWRPLCDFLGLEVPDGDFPRVNDRRTVKRALRVMKALAYIILLLGVLAAIAVAFVVVELVF